MFFLLTCLLPNLFPGELFATYLLARLAASFIGKAEPKQVGGFQVETDIDSFAFQCR